MAKKDSASVQFASSMDDMEDEGHRYAVEIGREREYESPAPLSSGNMSSAEAATAWRIRRGRNEPPLPYSKRTRKSLYDFDEK